MLQTHKPSSVHQVKTLVFLVCTSVQKHSVEVVVLFTALTAGTCAAPSSCTATSGNGGRWPEPAET